MNFFKLLLVFMLVTINYNAYSQETLVKEVLLEIDKTTNCKLRYYYYPNLQAYFDHQKNVFYYQDGGIWQTAPSLPKNYGGYSLYKMNHVFITDYDDDEPYLFLQLHKKQYPYNFRGAKM